MLNLGKRTVNMVGIKYSRLLVIEYAGTPSKGNTSWLCKCDCGNKVIVQGGTLKNGSTKSCGCFHKEKITTHGKDGSKSYLSWAAMKQRCLNSKAKSFKDYGARGIKVCERWLKFDNFLEDMGEPSIGMSLDRIDNNGNYEPSNCRWTSIEIQNNNKRNNLILTAFGKSQSLTLWAREYNISPISLKSRINLKWEVERAISTPIHISHKRALNFKTKE